MHNFFVYRLHSQALYAKIFILVIKLFRMKNNTEEKEHYMETINRQEEYLAEAAEARLFSDAESRTEPDFNRFY